MQKSAQTARGSRLALACASLFALAAWAPAAAQAVSWNAPINQPAGSQPAAVLVDRLDGDSRDDLVIVNEDVNAITVLLGTGNPATPFIPAAGSPFGTSVWPQSVAAADFNQDGNRDLVVANQHYHILPPGPGQPGVGNVSILNGTGTGSFTGPTNVPLGTTHPLSVVTADFNGDGDPDIAVANEGYSSEVGNVAVLYGDSGSTFTGPAYFGSGNAPQWIVTDDFNNDNDPDLAVANEASNSVTVLLGGPAGSFTGPTPYGVGAVPRAVEVADFNGDSDPDLAVANEGSNDVSVLLGGAGGTFGAATNFSVCSSPTALEAARLNSGTDLDLVVVNELCASVSLLIGGAGGSFGTPANFAAGDLPDDVGVGHFNGDSYPDLAVASTQAAGGAGSLSILFERGTPPGTTLISSPSGLIRDRQPRFTFSSNDSTSTFECRFNSQSFAPCSGPGAEHTPPALSDGDYTFSVRATDDSARTGAAAVSAQFTVDATPPTRPSVTGVDPNQATNDNNSPKVRGTTSSGSPAEVRLYTDPSCTGTVAASGSIAAFSGTGITATVPDNTTTTFYATALDAAGNESPCSTSSVTYVEYSPPGSPLLTATDPPSPANNNRPRVRGTLGAGGPTTIKLYTNAQCDGAPAEISSATTFVNAGIPTSVPDNSSTTFYATATDQVGAVSPCSTSSITYVEDSTPRSGAPPGAGGPPAPIKVDVTGPAMTISGKPLRMQRSGIVSVTLSCPSSEPGGCQGSVSLQTVRRTVRLGKGPFRLRGGKSAGVKLRLSLKNRRLVTRLKRAKVLVVINARDQVGNARTSRKALTLNAAKAVRR